MSIGMVAAGGLGIGRTYSLGLVGSIEGKGAIGASFAGLGRAEAADFAKLFDCKPVAEERSSVETLSSAG